MRKKQIIFYDYMQKYFFDTCGNIKTAINPLYQIIIILPSTHLLITPISQSSHKNQEQAYTQAFEQLGLKGYEEYYFLHSISGLAYLYPACIVEDEVQKIYQDFINPPMLIPEIFLQLPYLTNLSEETFLLLTLQEQQGFCSIIHNHEVYFMYNLNLANVPCETANFQQHITQELTNLYPLLNFKNILPKCIFIHSPIIQVTWLETFFQEYWHINANSIQELPISANYEHINQLSNDQCIFTPYQSLPPIKYSKFILISLCLLSALILFEPLLSYIQAYIHLQEKQALNTQEIITKPTQRNMQFVIQSIQEDYFPIHQISIEHLNQIQSIQNLYNFYQHYRSISKALFLFVNNLPKEQINIEQITFSYDNQSYFMHCEITSRDYTNVLNFIHQLKQAQFYQHIQIKQNTFNTTHHQTLISITL